LNIQAIKPAIIEWRNGIPFSPAYQDIYYSQQGGVQETKHVFLKHNKLPERWSNSQHFSIAETGFGTGLNFMVTASQWLKSAPKNTTLDYFSIEKNPISKTDLSKIHQQWPQFSNISQCIIDNYPPLIQGFHPILLNSPRIRLILIWGDIEYALNQLDIQADCWFLDGFSPNKNPSMWSLKHCQKIAQLTKKTGSFSTYTAVGQVRRDLISAGFEVSKAAGFGHKRELLYGRLLKVPDGIEQKPWFNSSVTKPYSTQKALIIGAGIAGCSMANTLANQNWDVTLIDKNAQPAQGASGNPYGILYPKLTADYKALARFYTAAFIVTGQKIRALNKKYDLGFNECGVVQLATSDKLFRQMTKQVELLGSINGFMELLDNENNHFQYPGIRFPTGGYIAPRKLCQALLDEYATKITTQFKTHIDRIVKHEEYWTVEANGTIFQAPVLILANAFEATKLLNQPCFLTNTKGQISLLEPSTVSQQISHVICADRYFIPENDGQHVIGASYEINSSHDNLSAEKQLENIALINQQCCLDFNENSPLLGRTSYRATTADYLPQIGGWYDEADFINKYSLLKHGPTHCDFPMPQTNNGLYINCGHGSRGLISAYYSAEILASLITNRSNIAEQSIRHSIHPARFLINRLKRNNFNKK